MGRDRRGTPANGSGGTRRLWADEPEPDEAELLCTLCQGVLMGEERMEGALGQGVCSRVGRCVAAF